jgi:flagellar hook-basal body complex protein FliE
VSIKLDPSATAGANSAASRAAEMRELRAEMRDDMRIGGEPGIGPSGASQEVHEAGGFGAILEKTVMTANAKEREAVGKAEALAQGRIDDLHGTMITMKEADISLKLVGSVRDKLMDAFHELWRINV